MENIEKQSHWKIGPFIAVHVGILALVMIWLIPSTYALLHAFDIQMSYFFNQFAKFPPLFQHAWAFLNSFRADWLYDLVMISFILPYVIRGNKEERIDRAIHVFLICLVTLFSFLFINRILFAKVLQPRRLSPSAVLPDIFRLSSVVKWTKIKEFASSSFPGDHASTIFMFIVSQFHLQGKKWGLMAGAVSIPFIIPRLITCAHWWTDLFMGSLPIALLVQAWLFYTPLKAYLTKHIVTFIRWTHGSKECGQNL